MIRISIAQALRASVALLLSLFAQHSLLAQAMQVTAANTPPFTPQNLISNVFLGNGVEVTNITYNGQALAVGYFSSGTQAIGIERGIVLTTGRAASASAAQAGSDEAGSVFANNANGSTAFDASLDQIATSGLNDVAVYTITFIPTSDTLRFRYCFGSEEYPEFACTDYNDVFGFFIQGPGYPTPTNIAIIPNTNLPVAINNLHPFNDPASGPPCQPFNAQYYNSNLNSNKQPVYDGFTDVFIAEAKVTPCQPYTIKLAIADVGDSAFDSGVFLEAKSFGTGALRVEVITDSNDGTITEGCTEAQVRFSLPDPTPQSFPIEINVWGSATNGVDFTNLPTTFAIAPGQQYYTLPVSAIEDNIPDGGEFLAIDFQKDPCNRDTVYIYLRENALIRPALPPDTTLCIGGAQPLLLDGTAPVQLPPPTTFSNNQSIAIQPVNTFITSSINVFGIQPTTLGAGVVQSVCVNVAHPWIDDVDLFLVSPGGQVLELSTDNGAGGDNMTNTCFTPVATNSIVTNNPLAAPFTGNFMPEGNFADLWDGAFPTNGEWVLQVRDDQNGFNGSLLGWNITFAPSYQIDYRWSPGTGLSCTDCPQTNALPTQTTQYIVTATDNYGCEARDSIRLEIVDALPAPLITCANPDQNSIEFSWNNVPTATSYEVNIDNGGWQPASGATSHLISGLTTFTSVTIQVRAIGTLVSCPALVATETCIVCQNPTATLNITDASCAGSTDGTLSITPDNVNPPYTYVLDGGTGSASPNFSNLSPGTHNIRVSDQSGCTSNFPFEVASPAPIVPVISTVQDVRCFGGADGQLQVNISGGTPGFSYQWSVPSSPNSPTLSNRPIGSYTVTVTDAEGCTATASGNLTQPTALNINTQILGALCFGQSNGSINAEGSGGVGPYTYAWSNGVGSPFNPNLPAASFTVTLTDTQGCTSSSSVAVPQPPALSTNPQINPPTCHNGVNGSVVLNASGGTGALSYQWNDPNNQSSATAINLIPQNYQYTISDAQGCTLVQSVTVPNPAPMAVSFSSTPVSCAGGSNGSITASASGGITPYFYAWSDPNNQSSAQAQNLSAGAYTVTVRDNIGCTSSASINLSDPTPMSLSVTPNLINCFGTATGQALALATGGSAPYQYNWNNGASGANLSGVTAGIYTVTVRDARNCSSTQSSTIDQVPEITTQISPVAVKCFGDASGSLGVIPSGGVPGYNLLWTGPGGQSFFGAQVANLPAGIYRLKVTDNANCVREFQTEITEPPDAVLVTLPDVADTVCFLAKTGTATAIATGGTPPYTYLWNFGNVTTATIDGLASDEYRVTVTDANGCTQDSKTIIQQRSQLFVWADTEKPRCFNGNDGTAQVLSIFYALDSADLNLFTYNWSTTPQQNSRFASGLTALNQYTVTVTDDLGCTGTRSVTVGQPEELIPQVSDIIPVKCYGEANGGATASASGGSAPYTYLWSAAGETTASVSGLRAGVYRVTVTDSKSCPVTATASIPEPTDLKLNLAAQAARCFGEASGIAKALPGGGTAPYQIVWFNNASGTELGQLAAGTYQATVSDANGCTQDASVVVGQPLEPLGASTRVIDATCFGSSNGRIIFTPTGGTAPYRYALDNGDYNGSTIQIGLRAGTYLPRVVDINGCTLTLPEIKVEQLPQLLLDLGPDFTITLGQDTMLQALVANANGVLNYRWAPIDSTWLSCMDCSNPSVYNLESSHWFTLNVTDSIGCAAQDQIYISVVKPRLIAVPTGFTPNGDSANDKLVVHGQQSARIALFRVYDRWGELLYEAKDFATNDESMGWDGSFRGEALNPGVYIWVVEAVYRDGVREVFKGETTLIK
ncbi:MAG: choice-of-anchor L domain-containing protein [Chitinophagales bacterium]|nr:choice-of-anchor L domain-containing protein [Chitinophagales bacterium]